MKICLVGGMSITMKTPGGAERQMYLISKYFADSRNVIYFIIANYTGPELSSSGVHYPSTWNYGNGFPLIRFFTVNLASLRQTLRSINPDVIYTRGFSEYAPFVGDFAARNRLISIAGLAHDKDIDFKLAKSLQTHSSILSSIRFRIAFQRYQKYLSNCSFVIAQTKNQNETLLKKNINSVIIGNIVEPAPENLLQEESKDIIWVASFFKKKGPDKLLEIVNMMPETTFTIVGRLGDSTLRPLLDEIIARNNVSYLGHLEYHETQKEIAKHRIIINTSIAEGFSNVFLEAWSLGKPVVSLNVNPNNLLLGNESLGHCCEGRLKNMVSTITDLLQDPSARSRIGSAGMEYVTRNHGIENAKKLLRLILRQERDR